MRPTSKRISSCINTHAIALPFFGGLNCLLWSMYDVAHSGSPCRLQALVTEQAVARRERPDVRWQVCKSPRFSHVHVEHIYYVSGPSRKESLRAAVEVVVRQLLDLLSARKHIAHVMTVWRASACLLLACQRSIVDASLGEQFRLAGILATHSHVCD